MNENTTILTQNEPIAKRNVRERSYNVLDIAFACFVYVS